ncbi:MAG: hypothetical protein PHO56_05345 [Patescibacteria group bacterium]|nr:hypothetical protein [Patescibacteria group bacterium]
MKNFFRKIGVRSVISLGVNVFIASVVGICLQDFKGGLVDLIISVYLVLSVVVFFGSAIIAADNLIAGRKKIQI